MAIKLTNKQKQYLVAGVIMTGAFGFVYFKFFWLPISQKIKETQDKIEATTAKIQKAHAKAAQLSRVEADLAMLNEQASEAERRLPKTRSVPEILLTATALAQKHNVAINIFTLGGQAGKTYFYELFYPLSLRGSFHNIGRFLAAISLEQRIFNVTNVRYGTPNEKGELQVTLTLVSYQYKG